MQKNPLINFMLDRIYSVICHQENHKCFKINDQSLFVCARCTGIYFGAFMLGLFTLFNSIRELKLKVLIIATVPLLMDVLLVNLGIYSYNKFIAFSTGLLFGSIVYLFLLSELENFSNKSIKRNE